jgi:hypothetical protein
MSISKRVYDIYKIINQSDLVLYKNVTNETLAEFEKLLNESQPNNENERAQRYMLKSLYFSNPINFMRYLCDSQNRINALILWTESKYIVKYFNLQNKVYLLWDSASSSYKVSKYLPITQRATTAATATSTATATAATSETKNDVVYEKVESKPEPKLLNKKFRKFKKFNLNPETVSELKDVDLNTDATTAATAATTAAVSESTTNDAAVAAAITAGEFKNKSWADIVN